MRGKAAIVPLVPLRERITPAHAGKSLRSTFSFIAAKDHPRTCGEKRFSSFSIQPPLGSPPHMRGKANIAFLVRSFSGITPAHAGKSTSTVISRSSFWDHPRTCGEKFSPNATNSLDRGSPPHMRGKDPKNDAVQGSFRITPAHAGKSSPSAYTTS